MLLIAATTLLMRAENPGAAGAQSPTAAQKVAGAKVNDDDKVICRSEAATGTLFGGPRECHTKFDWRLINARSRENVKNFQERALQAYSIGNNSPPVGR